MNTTFYEVILDNLFDGVYYLDTNRIITYWNKSAERISGYSREEVIGRKCTDNILRHMTDNGTELCLGGCPAVQTLQDGKMREEDVFLYHKEGYRVPVSVRVSPIRDASGTIIGAVEIFSINEKRIAILKEVEFLKTAMLIDTLTGIGNRKHAEMILNTKLAALKTSGTPFGVLFLDIDHFKRVNDTYGHNAGDRMLRMVAQTIANTIRSMDVVCRWGGEEFIVIIPEVNLQIMGKIAERIRFLVSERWITEGENQVKVTVSIGGVLAEASDASDTIVQKADAQMYLSKAAGRNCVTIAGSGV
ncbi:MAG: sensor domain-containing diguanylate cyclase [Deltaproteobacteria bacterium]|nr:MAG: sensor domain-containing diguanylate cyclase [Deltaproteobacteria bacterium]